MMLPIIFNARHYNFFFLPAISFKPSQEVCTHPFALFPTRSFSKEKKALQCLASLITYYLLPWCLHLQLVTLIR